MLQMPEQRSGGVIPNIVNINKTGPPVFIYKNTIHTIAACSRPADEALLNAQYLTPFTERV